MTTDQHCQLLKDNGLSIPDLDHLNFTIERIGYFRLYKYMKYFKEGGKFFVDITIEDIVHLYEYDRTLRNFLFSAIEEIEVYVKSMINAVMTCKYGSHWYLDSSLFKKKFQEFHAVLITGIKKYCDDRPDDYFIKNYKLKYNEPELPPSWMVMEILSFGKISLMFEGILGTDERIIFSQKLQSHDNLLTSWLHSFTYVRNLCAHHSKILDINLTIKPKMPHKKSNVFLKESADNSKIYSVICCLQKLLKVINPTSNFKGDLFHFMDNYHQMSPQDLAFTLKWKEEEIWN